MKDDTKFYDYKGFIIKRIRLAYPIYEVTYNNEAWEMCRKLKQAKSFVDEHGEAIKKYYI